MTCTTSFLQILVVHIKLYYCIYNIIMHLLVKVNMRIVYCTYYSYHILYECMYSYSTVIDGIHFRKPVRCVEKFY